MKTIMAVGGHIGDMELTAGGVLASRALAGDRIVTVAMTGGEKGNPPGMTPGEYLIQKKEEARLFAEGLGGTAEVLPIADGTLNPDEETAMALADLIRRHKPQVLITHWKNSIHKDHGATHRLVKDAQFYAGLPGFVRDLPPHFASGPYYAENWEDAEGFVPRVYVRVSPEGYEKWRELIARHWFALNSPSFRYRDYYAHLMALRGIESRKEYAQAFMTDPMAERTHVSGF